MNVKFKSRSIKMKTNKLPSPNRKSTSARLLIANTAATAAPHRLHPNPNPNPQTPRLQKRRKTRTVCYSVVKACIIMAGFAKGCSVYPSKYSNMVSWRTDLDQNSESLLYCVSVLLPPITHVLINISPCELFDENHLLIK